MEKRTLLVIILGLCIWIFLVGKLFSIQVLHNREYRLKGENQHQRRLTLHARRGNIFDRDGVKLVFNLPVKSFYAVPGEVADPQRLGHLFGQLLNRPSRLVIASLNKKSYFTWLARKMGPMESALIESWAVPGVYEQEEMERYYPGRTLACQTIGFTDIDNKGLEGIELQFDDVLSGKNGWVVVQMDACGRKIPLLEYPRKEPCDGHSLILTLHSSYQAIAEQELARGLQDTGARAGCVLLMDPKTGEILALANEPKYDLNDPAGVLTEWRRNRTITDMFEPGSTFKIVTAAAALEEDIQKPEDLIYCEGGQMRVHGKVFHDVEENDWLTFQQVIGKSSNIGTIKVARKVGPDTFYRYARAFGFGNHTDVQLPGEVKGVLAPPRTFSGLSLPSMAIGHEVAVTPLQLVCAYAAVANGGTLMKPLIVRYVLDEYGNVVERFSPTPVRRVISPQTATTIRSFLTMVVESGTGQMAKVEGLQVAGKTGTAYKLNEDGSGFSNSRFMASFCGFFPADVPRLVGLIVLDEPKNPHSGGRAAAPIFRRIGEHILHLPKGPCADLCLKGPSVGEDHPLVVVPDLCGMDRAKAIDVLAGRGLQSQPEGQGLRVCHQQPQAGLLVACGDTVLIDLCSPPTSTSGEIEVPQVTGLTLREAIWQFKQHDLDVNFSGSGVVVKQIPPAGQRVAAGMLCLIECQPSKSEKGLVAVVAKGVGGTSPP